MPEIQRNDWPCSRSISFASTNVTCNSSFFLTHSNFSSYAFFIYVYFLFCLFIIIILIFCFYHLHLLHLHQKLSSSSHGSKLMLILGERGKKKILLRFSFIYPLQRKCGKGQKDRESKRERKRERLRSMGKLS